MMCDADPQVRTEVARRIPAASLGMMANDSEMGVRRIVAERMNPEDVIVLLNDTEWLIRLIVIQRVDISVLKALTKEDEDPEVRAEVRKRLSERSE
jgi:hypothetical protein